MADDENDDQGLREDDEGFFNYQNQAATEQDPSYRREKGPLASVKPNTQTEFHTA
jgi:hypothetical protein